MKEMHKKSIAYTVKNNLCVGCGLCSDACPTGSINIGEYKGTYLPTVNSQTCINNKGCHRCSSICPGVGINLMGIGQKLYGSNTKMKYHKLIGWYTKAYSGFSNDYETRYHAASGGIISAFIAFLLDKNYISAAVVTENDVKQEFLNKTILVHSSKDLYKCRSSKYCPVKFDGIIKQVKEENGLVVIVGLPCVIHGFRKYEEVDKKFKEKIFGYFGLYCSGNRTFNLTEYVFKQHRIDKSSLSYFQYRDDGCLGSLVAHYDTNVVYKEAYQKYYHPLRSFFTPKRCYYCIDHYAELADVSFGDIHYGKYKEDKVGVNSFVIRNTLFDKLFFEAENEGYLQFEDLSEDNLVRCQASAKRKKSLFGGILHFAKLIGKKTPKYDMDITGYSFFKSVVTYLFVSSQMFVGKRKWLWWVIPLLARKGHVD